MPTPQPGIFALGTRSHYYLELDLRPDADPRDLVDAVAELREPRATTGGANLVVAYGAELWRRVAPDGVPSGLGPFTTIEGIDGTTVPAAQHDAWIWTHGLAYDVVFDVARAVAEAVAPAATVAAEHAGFTYGASRDLTGFEDGTENPPVDEAPFVATVPEGEPGAGGSVVLFQRWNHDLGAFHALGLHDQELVFGRTKAASDEIPDEERPEDAHISRVVIEDDEGEELEVFRRSTSHGTVAEHGLLFVAFSADVARLERMLHRMYGLEDGRRDRLTDFSTVVSSAWYVAPSLEAMRTSAP